MSSVDLTEKRYENFPNLPKPKLWDEHETKRFYFTRYKDGQDHIFFMCLYKI